MMCLFRLQHFRKSFHQNVLVKAAEPGSPDSYRYLLEKHGGPETNRWKAWKMELVLSGDEVLAALRTQFSLVRVDR